MNQTSSRLEPVANNNAWVFRKIGANSSLASIVYRRVQQSVNLDTLYVMPGVECVVSVGKKERLQ